MPKQRKCLRYISKMRLILDMSQQSALAAQKAIHNPGCLKRMGSRSGQGILSLCSTLVRAHQESCVQLWSPQHRKDIDLLEQVQMRPQKRSEG